jgi:glucose-6-phosphate 1-epimerase
MAPSAPQTVDQLRKSFAVAGVRIDAGAGGLGRLRVETPASRAELYLHGAHLTRWQPAGAEPVLWMSQNAVFESGKAIRGGVPICFPWFGPAGDFVLDAATAPLHGPARTTTWALTELTRELDEVHITLRLEPFEALKKFWPAGFDAEMRFNIGRKLEMTLHVANRQSKPITFEAALHTYFDVSNVEQVWISGLENTRYLSKVEMAESFSDANPVRFSGETDRVYQDTTTTCVLHDPGMNRRIVNEKSGSKSTVVWNPWPVKARAINLAEDEWRRFACIETAALGDNRITLPAASTHDVTARISVLSGSAS